MKVVICPEYGVGFLLSASAQSRLGNEDFEYHEKRADPRLVETVERFGDAAGAAGSTLVVREIPDGSHWLIVEDDGAERLFWSMTKIHPA